MAPRERGNRGLSLLPVWGTAQPRYSRHNEWSRCVTHAGSGRLCDEERLPTPLIWPHESPRCLSPFSFPIFTTPYFYRDLASKHVGADA
jgi:hypothetical protein